ncbi:hypothetical protein [Microseira wollei]|uniref:Uncharacterized protein n=1 Tax=Microseira wollei NIES-4236 TaxID=2530354 RepID=A0AAV3XST5_9CYAN|nr:hypothetical protein [Microseira wollei]GET44189.1 hypothetical protein MiSe_90150 [Microseira wollei NIES-4236]
MLQTWQYRTRLGNHLYIQTSESRQLEYNRNVLLRPEFAKDVRLYNLGLFFKSRYKDIFQRTIAILDRLHRQIGVRVAVFSILAAAASGVVYLYVVWLVTQVVSYKLRGC